MRVGRGRVRLRAWRSLWGSRYLCGRLALGWKFALRCCPVVLCCCGCRCRCCGCLVLRSGGLREGRGAEVLLQVRRG